MILRIELLSNLYRLSRFIITNIVYIYQKLFLLPNDLEPAVDFGDRALSGLSYLRRITHDFPTPKGYSLEIHDLTFPSPLIGASFKSDTETLDSWLRMGLGGLIFKTIMRNRRDGNPRPRLKDFTKGTEKGLVNALGLPGPGIDDFVTKIPTSSLWSHGRPLGISVGGDNFDDYIHIATTMERALKNQRSNYFYELNISCPNTENGRSIGDEPGLLNELILKLRKEISKVISIKVSPDTSNRGLDKIAEVCDSHESLIINAGNTQYKAREELELQEKDFSMKGGGVSGPLLFTRTLEMVKIFSNFSTPIMATGGISNLNHLNALQNAGASLFGMATSLVLDPYCIPRINQRIRENVYDSVN